VEPTAFVPEYFVEITEEQAQSMGITSETPTLVLTTASIPGGRPEEMTLNLAGPVLINLSTRTARQLVLEGDGYTIKHRVFPAEDQSAVRQAA
jgi:flagellar assembly factor FliW